MFYIIREKSLIQISQHYEKGAATLNSTGILPPTSMRNLCCSGYHSEETQKQQHRPQR